MTLQASGPISLANVQTEFGGASPTNISEYYGAAQGVPTSGRIALSDFYGKSFALPPVPSTFYTGQFTQQSLPDGTLLLFLNTSGTLTLDASTGAPNGFNFIETALVGGGGGSANDGGGGAGGLLHGTGSWNIGGGSYAVTIGNAPPGDTFSATKGGDTIFNGWTAVGGCGAQFNVSNNNGANGGGSCDSTVCGGNGGSPSGQPGFAGLTAYGGFPGGSHGCGRGSGSGGGATAGGGGSQTPGGMGKILTIANGQYTKQFSTGGRSTFVGGGSNQSGWTGGPNTGDGGISNQGGGTGQVIIWIKRYL